MATNGQSDPPEHTPPPGRSRRASLPVPFAGVRVTWTTLLGTVAIISFLGGGIALAWTAATSFNEKAPKSAVRDLQQRHVQDVHRLEIGVYRIQMEQRTIMRAVAPAEAAKLAPVPEPRALKPFPEME